MEITPIGTYVVNGDGVIGSVHAVIQPTAENGHIRPIYQVADCDGNLHEHPAVYEIID